MAEERGTRLIAVCWSLVAASAVMLFLRVYCKLWRRRGLWWDDHFLIISWVSRNMDTAPLQENVGSNSTVHRSAVLSGHRRCSQHIHRFTRLWLTHLDHQR